MCQNTYKVNNKKNCMLLKNRIQTYMMVNGKKNLCEKILLKTSKLLQKRTKKNHINLITRSLINATSIISTKKIKKSKRKTIKEFPYILNKKNRLMLSIKRILHSLKRKSKITNELFLEIIAVSRMESDVLKSKEESHNTALIKKKYAYFRWFC